MGRPDGAGSERESQMLLEALLAEDLNKYKGPLR